MGILDNFLDEERYSLDIQLRGFCVDFINQTLKREINIDANLADIVETHEAIQFDRGKAFYHCTKRDSLAFPGLQIYQITIGTGGKIYNDECSAANDYGI